MALEDIDEAGEAPKLDLGQVNLDADAGTAPQDAQDEDLFEFPDEASPAPVREASGAARREAVGSPPPAPVAAAEDTPQDSLIAGTPGTPGYDPELDQDLFDFGAIFAGGDILLDPGADVVVAPATISVVGPSLLDDEPQSEEDARGATNEPDDDDLIALAGPDPAPAAVPAAVPAAADRGRDKLVMVLTAAFLVVNTAVILLAWQANSSFRSTIADVTRSIAEGLSNTNPPAQAAPTVEYVPVPTPSHTPRTADLPPSALESHSEQAITIARRLMSAGRFMDARRTLSYVLSNTDLLTIDRELVAEAEFLIAETYELQGNALLQGESR